MQQNHGKTDLWHGIVFDLFAVGEEDGLVDPRVLVFAHQPVTTEEKAAEKTFLAQSFQGIL
jgi:hypothetical protein